MTETSSVMTILDFQIQEVGVIPVVNPPHFHQLVNVVQKGLGVVPHAARVVIDDVLERRQLIPDLKQLVNLLLILDDGETDAGILQARTTSRRRLHPGTAAPARRKRLGGAHHHVQMRAVCHQ